MTIGEFGCVVSHMRTWGRCHHNYIYPILILEQDFVPLFDLNWSVFDEIENYDWDIILLGRQPLAKDTEVGLNYFDCFIFCSESILNHSLRTARLCFIRSNSVIELLS